jgi:hypothetical protein
LNAWITSRAYSGVAANIAAASAALLEGALLIDHRSARASRRSEIRERAAVVGRSCFCLQLRGLMR